MKQALPRSPKKKLDILRNLSKEFGVCISTPKVISRERLSAEVLNKVKNFYEREDVSRWTPGRKEFMTSIDSLGEKIKIQKRYLVSTLRETFAQFNEEYPNVVCKSKFCDLRPSHILPFGKTPLEACCCLHHKNFQNLCDSLSPHFADMNCYSSTWIEQHCLCQPVGAGCKNFTCQNCDKILSDFIKKLVESGADDSVMVKYAWWVSEGMGVERLQAEKTLPQAIDVSLLHKHLCVKPEKLHIIYFSFF